MLIGALCAGDWEGCILEQSMKYVQYLIGNASYYQTFDVRLDIQKEEEKK